MEVMNCHLVRQLDIEGKRCRHLLVRFQVLMALNVLRHVVGRF